ncbi:GrpB family protein [Anaerostipes sp.]|uniref:GrpB family protein n=1 Tax=Anaerostipes sp. TaxID=1872530 RepID=UPI0025BAE52F|nr:GrpB family protein [Anaerostipes sp.]MBS7007864.1 GrpB family protein [Anaerostipes sp.]
MKKLTEMSNEELWGLFPIVLSGHKKEWKQMYENEKKLLLHVIGKEHVARISHIGSTAVEGLLAKPTIDILLEIREGYDLDHLVRVLEKEGYIFTRKPANPPPHMMFMKGYTLNGFAKRVYHLHVRYPGDWDELYFRDYLRRHKSTAEEYGKLKVGLQKRFEHDRDAYTRAKTDFVRQCTKKARKEFGDVYRPGMKK